MDFHLHGVSLSMPVDDVCVVAARETLCLHCVSFCIIKCEQCCVSTQPGVEEEMTASQQASCGFLLPLSYQLLPISAPVWFRFPINRLKIRSVLAFHAV